MKGIFRWDA